MWLFPTRSKDAAALKKVMEKFTGSNLLEKELILGSIKIRPTRYMLFSIRQNEDYLNTIAGLYDYAIARGFDVCSTAVSFVLIYFFEDKNADDTHELLLFFNEMPEPLKAQCKAVYSTINCPVGLIGSEKRMHYTPLIPSFEDKVKVLISLDFGQIKFVK